MMITINTSAKVRACAIALFFVCLDISTVFGQQQVLQCKTCMLEDSGSRVVKDVKPFSVLGVSALNMYYRRGSPTLSVGTVDGLDRPLFVFDYGHGAVNVLQVEVDKQSDLVDMIRGSHVSVLVDYTNYSAAFRFDPWYEEYNIGQFYGVNMSVGFCFSDSVVMHVGMRFVRFQGIVCGAILQSSGFLFTQLTLYGLVLDGLQTRTFWTSYVLLLEQKYGIEYVEDVVPLSAAYPTGIRKYFLFAGDPVFISTDPERFARSVLAKVEHFEPQGVLDEVQQLAFDTTMLVTGLYNHYYIAKGQGIGHWLSIITFARSQLRGQFVHSLSINDIYSNKYIGPTITYLVAEVQKIVTSKDKPETETEPVRAPKDDFVLRFTTRDSPADDYDILYKEAPGVDHYRPKDMSDRDFLHYLIQNVSNWQSPVQRQIDYNRADVVRRVNPQILMYWRLCHEFPLFSFKEMRQFFKVYEFYLDSGCTSEIAFAVSRDQIAKHYVDHYSGNTAVFQPQGLFTQHPALKSLISLCAVAITVLGMKDITLDKAISSVSTAMKFHTFVRGADLVSSIVEGLETVFTTLKTIYATKSFDCLIDCTKEMYETDKDVRTVLSEIENMDMLNLEFPTSWLQCRMQRLTDAQDKYAKWKVQFPHKRVDIEALNVAAKLVSDVASNKFKMLCNSRPKPFCFLLGGTSSIGKTSLLSMILAQYAFDAPRCPNIGCRNGGSGLDPNGYAFSTLGNTTDEYDTEVSNSQWGLIFDDVCVVGPRVNNGAHIGTLIQKLIRVINIAPASSQQASLERKGKIFYNHSLVGITTNTPDMFVRQIAAHPAAVLRRIDVFVDIEVKDEYKITGTSQLDGNIIAQKSLYEDQKGQVPNAWIFRMYNYAVVDGREREREILRTGDTTEFLEKMSELWFENARNESRAQRSCGIGTFRCCTNCHLVGADADGLCHRPRCRSVAGDIDCAVGSMSVFALCLKLLVDYKLDWVATYLTYMAGLSTIVLEEYIKRCAYGNLFPLVEYVLYNIVFGLTWKMALYRMVPLFFHYLWLHLDMEIAVILHFTYNTSIFLLERQYKTLFLANFYEILSRSQDLARQYGQLACIGLYILLRTDLVRQLWLFLEDNGAILERVVVIVWFLYYILDKDICSPRIVHTIRVPIYSAIEDACKNIYDRVCACYFRGNKKYVVFFAAVLAALVVLKGANVLGSMRTFKPQGFGDEPVKGKDIWTSVPVQTPIHSPGTHPKPFATKLVMNTVEIVFKHNGVDQRIKALAIAGSSFLMTKHEAMVLYGKGGCKICLRQPSTVSVNDFQDEFDTVRYRVSRSNSQLFVDEQNFNFHPKKDLCVLTVNTTPFPSLVNYFPLSVQSVINNARTVGVCGDEHQVYKYPRLRYVREVLVSGQQEQCAYLGHGFDSEENKIICAVGFCGNVLFNALRGCNAIYGIHNSGLPSDGTCAFVPVIREDLEFFLRNAPIMDVQDMLGEVYPAHAGELVYQQEKQSFHRKNAFGFCEPLDGAPCRLWMTLGNACQIDLKSKYVESRFVEWWLKARVRVGSTFKNLMEATMHVPRLPPRWRWLPQYRFAEVVTQAKEFLPPSVVQNLANQYLDRLLANVEFLDRLRGVRPLSLDEAVNGIQGARYIKKLNMQSSAGYPYNKPKRDICSFDGIRYMLPQCVIERFRLMVARLNKGKMAGILFSASVKDEPVSLKKITSPIQDRAPGEVSKDDLNAAIDGGFGKIRVFQAISLEGCLIIRTFFLMLVSLLQEFRYLSCIAVGLNCFSHEWDELYEHMTPDWGLGEHRFICGDFSNYDQRIATEFLKAAWRVLRELWMHTDYFFQLGPEEKMNFVRLLDVLTIEMSNPLSWFWGDLVHLQGGNASGHPLTVIINGIVNYMYMAYAFSQIYPDKDFSEFVRFMTYGDDNILTVHPDCPDFNQIEITRVLAEIGVIYTSSDKKVVSEPYEKQLTFLKRTWVKRQFELDDGPYEYYACPLDWSSFSKTLSLEKRIGADSDVRMVTVLLSLSLEMMQYGPTTHNSFISVADQFLAEHKLGSTFNESVKEGWMTMEAFLRNRRARTDAIPSLSPMFSDSETD